MKDYIYRTNNERLHFFYDGNKHTDFYLYNN